MGKSKSKSKAKASTKATHSKELDDEVEPGITWFAAFTTYFDYATLILLGRIRDIIGPFFNEPAAPQRPPKGMAPLIFASENFYTRRMYYRVQEAFNRPIKGAPGAFINVIEREPRKGDVRLHIKEGTPTKRCLNLGSYNYLGFADDWMNTCGEDVLEAVDQWPLATGSSRMDAGTFTLHRELEKLMADFLGKEDAIVFKMGFATNSATIPALTCKGDLIISDALNHTSIVNGARSSQALVRIFKHNDPANLESVLREAISMGQPRTRRPWNKIIVAVEGIYSMEGEICNLKEIAEVCKKYKVYLYLDEAHSIGALGETGRGVCEYCGVDTRDVAIMMGTFTKSFGGMGGYIAGDKATIDHLRVACAGSLYQNSMSPVVCQQVITAFQIIKGEKCENLGERKLQDLRENSNYFRAELKKIGLHVYGNYDSPVIPVLLYNPTKILAFSRFLYERGIAVVVVGFPATPVVLARCRFCISAGHSRADLEEAIEALREIAELLKVQYSFSMFG